MMSDLEILENAHFNVQQSLKLLSPESGGVSSAAVRFSLTVAEKQLEEVIQWIKRYEASTSTLDIVHRLIH